jgi:hypothetical protein
VADFNSTLWSPCVATGITAYLNNGGTFENARTMKARAAIAVDGAAEIAPLPRHCGVVRTEHRATADRKVRLIAGKGLMPGFVREKHEPIVVEVQLIGCCLHGRA